MKTYDDITLKKVQKLELEILKDFLKVCEEHELTYFGLAGTGIGAIRHNGFIPWDDDIDVGLPRSDYERLLNIFQTELSSKYTIGNAENFQDYPLMTTRIMLKGTKFVEESLKNVKCELGIFLDVYAFDNIPDDEKKFKRQAYKTWFWSKILILRQIPFPVLPFGGVLKKIIHLICLLIHGSLKLLQVSPTWIYNRCKKASTKYNNTTTSRMAYLCDTSPFINMIDKKEAFPLVPYKFEGVDLLFPKNIREMLTFTYGNYMELPPIEKRKNHYPYCLDFGDRK